MTISDPIRRRAACGLARAGAALALAMLSLSTWVTLDGGLRPALAAEAAGGISVVVPKGLPDADDPLTGGGSATPFGLVLPVGASCTGDSASGGYRIQSYVVPATVDPATLTFGPSGPVPPALGASFRQPLFDTTSAPFVAKLTDIAATSGGGGNISGLPAFDFKVFGEEGSGSLPPGAYNVGIACTKGPASATQLDRYWNAVFTFVADPADQPTGVRFTVTAAPARSTVTLTAAPETSAALGRDVVLTATVVPATAAGTITFKDGTATLGEPVAVAAGTASLTTSRLALGDRSITAAFTPTGTTFAPSTSSPLLYKITAASSTTTVARGTTTTVPGATTTTTAPGSTTTTTLGTGTTTTTAVVLGTTFSGGSSAGGSASSSFGPSGTSVAGTISSLPVTGGSTSIAVWGALLLVFGRMAVLLGRTPEVVPVRVA